MDAELVKLIKLINSNKTLNEISNITGLTNKQLFIKFEHLKQLGYVIEREYNYNGEINYALSNPFQVKEPNEITINMPTNSQKFRTLIISDTHLGHLNDNLKSIAIMMEYCLKEGIHNIFHAGDFFHGIFPNDSQDIKVTDPFEQIEYGLNNYPYDKNIITYICLGNHDATFWLEDGLDIKKILLEKRHDLVPIGYGNSKINILNNSIYINHPIERAGIISTGHQNIIKSLIIKGHSHKFKISTGGGCTIIHTPTLSTMNISTDKSSTISYPSLLDMELTLNESGITYIYLQHFIIVNKQLIRISEIENPQANLSHKLIIEDKTINLKPKLTTITTQENKKRVLAKTPQDYKGMNQIEKFNSRYER